MNAASSSNTAVSVMTARVLVACLGLTSCLTLTTACIEDAGTRGDPADSIVRNDDGGERAALSDRWVPLAPTDATTGDAALGAEDDGPGRGGEPDVAPLQSACVDGIDNDGDGRTDLDDPGCDGPLDDDEFDIPTVAECGDGIDGDGDGDTDLEDPDCVSGGDPTERGDNPTAACNDGVDNDGDGLIDFPHEPGCRAAGDDDEADPPSPPACSNGRDDDDDARIDFPNDPGCGGHGDTDENDPPVAPACANGLDDDGNGATDYPDDPGCESAGDFGESSSCGDHREVIDLNSAMAAAPVYVGDLRDGEVGLVGTCGGNAGGEVVFAWRVERPVDRVVFRTDLPQTQMPTVLYVRDECVRARDIDCNRGVGDRPGTRIALEDPTPGLYYVVVDTGSRDGGGTFGLTVEETAAPGCRDGEDNDGDGFVDLADPGCTGPIDGDEADPPLAPECADGLDNDDDGSVDYPDDRDCQAAGTDRERPLCAAPFSITPVGQGGGIFDVSPDPSAESFTDGTCTRSGVGGEHVFALRLEDPSALRVEVTSAVGAADAIVYLRRDCDVPGTEIACNTASLSVGELEAGHWFVFVEPVGERDLGPWSVSIAPASLIRACSDDVDNDGDGIVDLADPGCQGPRDDREDDPIRPPQCADERDNDGDGNVDWPDDDGCRAAGDTSERVECLATDDIVEVADAGGRFDVDTTAHDNLYEGSCGARGPEAIVALILTRAAEVTAEIVAGNYDTMLFVRASCDEAGSEIGCNDDGGEGLLSRLAFARLEAGTYFFFVDGFGARSGQATLELTVSLFRPPMCSDEDDNDGDGDIDLADSGCTGPADDDESRDPDRPDPACANGADDDEDGDIDWPHDGQCRAAGGESEQFRCDLPVPVVEVGHAGGEFEIAPHPGGALIAGSCGNGAGPETVYAITLDEPSDIAVSVADADGRSPVVVHGRALCDVAASEIGCRSPNQAAGLELQDLLAGTYFVVVEPMAPQLAAPVQVSIVVSSNVRECNDGVDNDGDALVDLADPGCVEAMDDAELDAFDPAVPPACFDEVDNDGDDAIDYPDDPGCRAAGDGNEAFECALVDDVVSVDQAGGLFSFDTSQNENLYAGATCGGGGRANEQVVAIQIEVPSSLTVETVEAAHDPMLFLRAMCDEPDTQIACDDDGGERTLSRLSVARLEPGVYFLFVDGYGANSAGPVDVSISIVPL